MSDLTAALAGRVVGSSFCVPGVASLPLTNQPISQPSHHSLLVTVWTATPLLDSDDIAFAGISPVISDLSTTTLLLLER